MGNGTMGALEVFGIVMSVYDLHEGVSFQLMGRRKMRTGLLMR